MKCSQARKAMSKRKLGFLTTQKAEALELHVAACADCREAARYLDSAYAALQQPQAEERLPQLAERVLYRAQNQNPVPFKLRFMWWMPLALGTTAVLAIAFLTPVFHISSEPMTKQEVLNAYKQDLQDLGIYQTNEEKTNSDSFDYEEYGIPTSVSQLMI